MIEPDSGLSERENEILRLVATGASNKEIAQQLFISTNTVKVHLRNIFAKIGASSRTEAAMYAVNRGLVPSQRAAQASASPALPLQEERVSQTAVPATGSLTVQPGDSPLRSPWLLIPAAILGLALLAVLVYLISGQNQPAVSVSQTSTRWFSLENMPTARGSMAAVVVEDQIFVLGGENESGILDKVEVFATESGAWSVREPMPWAAAGIQAAALGNKIYIPGGRLASGDISSALSIFDVKAEAWSQGAKLPFPLSNYALAVYDSKLYLFGGWDGQGIRDSVLEYDPEKDEWTSRSALSVPRMDAAALLIDDEIHLLGGADQAGALDLYQVYSPAQDIAGNNPWKDEGPMPQARSSLGATAVMDVIYLVGGQGKTAGNLPALGYLTETSEWLEIPAPHTEQVAGSSLLFLDTHIFSLGGWVDQQASAQLSSFQVLFITVLPFVP